MDQGEKIASETISLLRKRCKEHTYLLELARSYLLASGMNGDHKFMAKLKEYGVDGDKSKPILRQTDF